MDMKIASKTDRGRLREINEDSLLADLPLVVVADGMGGHVAGEVASKLAVDVLGSWKQRFVEQGAKAVAESLKEAFREANAAVFEKGSSDESLQGMGTTLTAAWIDDGTVTLAHVGDSRAYLLRGNDLQQITQDQTLAQEWVRRGRISVDEAETIPQRHVLLQSIGTETGELNVEVTSIALQPGDRLLLASDGLTGMVPDAAMRTILSEKKDPDEAAQALVDAANAAGGQDNISVLLVDADGPPPADGASAPVVVEKPVTERRKRRVLRPTYLIAAAVVAVSAAAAVVFLAGQAAPTYVVSSRSGHVVVLRGHPGKNDHAATGKVVIAFPKEKLDRFPTPTQRDLRTGIEATSMTEARQIIAQLPRKLGQNEKATPTPRPTATGSPGPKTPLPSPTR